MLSPQDTPHLLPKLMKIRNIRLQTLSILEQTSKHATTVQHTGEEVLEVQKALSFLKITVY